MVVLSYCFVTLQINHKINANKSYWHLKMSWATIDDLDTQLKRYWEDKSPSGVNTPSIRIVTCNVNGTFIYLPVYLEDRNFVYAISKSNVFAISKSKCKINKTEKKSLYYDVIPSEQDISIGKIPIRPIGCPKIIGQLGLTNLAKHEL